MKPSDMTDSLLAPIDDTAPAGPNLEYDPAFTELEQFAMPTPERVMGDSLKAAQEPDWDKVASAAEALLARTKDLRIAIHLCVARTRRQGLVGWVASLCLVRGLLERYWDDVHPQMDADDGYEPTARANAVMPLADPLSALGYFRVATFVQSPRLGRFSLRDLRVATGAIKVSASADGTPPPTLVELEACCMDCPDEQLRESATLLAEARDHASSIIARLHDKLGAASPDLSHLSSDIEELKKFVDTQCVRRFPAHLEVDAAAGTAPDEGGPGASTSQPAYGKIAGHEDVIRRLDEICEYYERIEPSSPLPVLLKRARRLVGKRFADVLKDIAPGGLAELQMLSGPDIE
ncbi:type VI secretion system protein TssA [Paraburkholderia caffeinilytica]|uniref:type VI secretion system protein TssA n=1 Tax=Paraburkholderia caffeinilytica TaxID=1761016 RepID=UPI0038BCE686